MWIFWTVVILMILSVMILKGLWNLWMHQRLLHLFHYQMAKNDVEWNQEYAKKLNQYALTQQEIDDFQLCQVLQKCDYTYTNIGREYMYGRMVSGKYEYQLLETMIERYKDQKILSHTLYELYQLSKEYDRCLGLFDHHDVFTLWEKRLIQVLSFGPLLFLLAFFVFGHNIWLPFSLYLGIMVALHTYFSQRIQTIMSETMSYCCMVETFSRPINHHVFPESIIQDALCFIKKEKRYTFLTRMISKVSKIDVFYFTQTIQSFLFISLHQYFTLLKHRQDIEKHMMLIYEYIGIADLALSVLLLREHEQTCLPVFVDEKKISFVEAYHPLIKNPVKNSFTTSHSCMITGSNASGKSTFLKVIGVNMVMAKTLHTCFADEWICYDFTIHSAIHMKDDLTSGDSYYVKEIKTLKTMIDDVKVKDCLIFIDEILRGTNETERVMISQAILNYLFQSSSIVLVTTHDLSLVEKFQDIDQYCFRDAIINQQLSCDYKIHKGRCTVGNAIALLEIYGYHQDILCQLKKPN